MKMGKKFEDKKKEVTIKNCFHFLLTIVNICEVLKITKADYEECD